jgi:hypothetical protein
MKKQHQRLSTLSQKMFEGRVILNERPEGMPFEDYRVLRAVQQKLIKLALKK